MGAEDQVRARVVAPEADLGRAGLFIAWFERRISLCLCSTLFHAQCLRDPGGFTSPEHAHRYPPLTPTIAWLMPMPTR